MLVRLFPSALSRPRRNKLFGINGLDATAQQSLKDIESVTGRQDLRCMTMLTWRNVLPRHGLLSDNFAWCPICFMHDNVPYLRLAWALKAVKVCPLHCIRLQTICPHCQANARRITGKTRAGFCFQCGKWLGQAVGTESIQEDIVKVDLIIADLAAKLLSVAGTIKPPTGVPVFTALNKARTTKVSPNGLSMHRTLCIKPATYISWITIGNKPSLATVLDICYKLGVDPIELLVRESFGRMHDWKKIQHAPLEKPEATRRRRTLNHSDIRGRLEAIASCTELPPATFKQVCEDEQLNQSIVRRHFPDLSRRIAHRARLYRAECGKRKRQADVKEIKSVVKALHKAGKKPTLSRVAELLKRPSMMLDPAYRLVLREARAALH